MSPQNDPPLITEHALVRYMERVLGLDLTPIRAEILNPRNTQLITSLRTCRIPVGNGCDLVCIDGRIVSVAQRAPSPGVPRKKKRR